MTLLAPPVVPPPPDDWLHAPIPDTVAASPNRVSDVEWRWRRFMASPVLLLHSAKARGAPIESIEKARTFGPSVASRLDAAVGRGPSRGGSCPLSSPAPAKRQPDPGLGWFVARAGVDFVRGGATLGVFPFAPDFVRGAPCEWAGRSGFVEATGGGVSAGADADAVAGGAFAAGAGLAAGSIGATRA